MGWSSGNEVFDPVVKQLAIEVALGTMSEQAAVRVTKDLIKALQACDWDTYDESLSDLTHLDWVVEAFRQVGIYTECGAHAILDHQEPDSRIVSYGLWVRCDLPKGHMLDMHRDSEHDLEWPVGSGLDG